MALAEKKGIRRYGDAMIPMDEALVLAAVDVSGRGQLHYDVDLPIELIGSVRHHARQGVLHRVGHQRRADPAHPQPRG